MARKHSALGRAAFWALQLVVLRIGPVCGSTAIKLRTPRQLLKILKAFLRHFAARLAVPENRLRHACVCDRQTDGQTCGGRTEINSAPHCGAGVLIYCNKTTLSLSLWFSQATVMTTLQTTSLMTSQAEAEVICERQWRLIINTVLAGALCAVGLVGNGASYQVLGRDTEILPVPAFVPALVA